LQDPTRLSKAGKDAAKRDRGCLTHFLRYIRVPGTVPQDEIFFANLKLFFSRTIANVDGSNIACKARNANRPTFKTGAGGIFFPVPPAFLILADDLRTKICDIRVRGAAPAAASRKAEPAGFRPGARRGRRPPMRVPSPLPLGPAFQLFSAAFPIRKRPTPGYRRRKGRPAPLGICPGGPTVARIGRGAKDGPQKAVPPLGGEGPRGPDTRPEGIGALRTCPVAAAPRPQGATGARRGCPGGRKPLAPRAGRFVPPCGGGLLRLRLGNSREITAGPFSRGDRPFFF
jgi:hypothetical protein